MIANRSLVQQHVPGDAKVRARWARTFAPSSKFYYTRVRLLNAALPEETANITANTTIKRQPLIIDANTRNYGRVGTFIPKCLVIAGNAVRREALGQGKSYAMAWVGENALRDMNVFASDGISYDELYQKLSAALRKKFKQGSGDGYDDVAEVGYSLGGPYISSVFPFDNNVIFSLNGQTFQLDYTIDTQARTVAFTGTPVKVEQEYVDVDGCGSIDSFDPRSRAPYVPTGLRVNPTMVLPSLFTVSLGAVNSELRNPMFGEAFLNVDKVVNAYLSDIKNGTHQAVVPWGSPIPLTRMVFAGELRNRGVNSPADFFVWVDANKSKTVSGDPVDADDFAYIGDPKKKETWKLPIHDKGHVRDAMSRFDQTDLPSEAKPKVARKISKRAKGMGIDTTDFDKEYTVKAGGPGSGPRPHGGSGTGHSNSNDQAATVSEFKNRGYSGHETPDPDGTVHLSKSSDDPNTGDRDAHIHEDGSWTHSDEHYNTKKGGASYDVAKQLGPVAVKAGGPGSGPRPGGGHDAYDDGQHGKKPSNDERGYEDGQRDPAGFKHDHDSRDATVAAFKDKGYKEDTPEPGTETVDHGGRSLSRDDGAKGFKHAEVHPDGTFTHTAGPWDTYRGRNAGEVGKLLGATSKKKSLRAKLLGR